MFSHFVVTAGFNVAGVHTCKFYIHLFCPFHLYSYGWRQINEANVTKLNFLAIQKQRHLAGRTQLKEN